MAQYETRKATIQGKAETLRRRSIRASRNTVRNQANKAYTRILTGGNLNGSEPQAFRGYRRDSPGSGS